MSVAGTQVLVTGAEGFIGSHVVEALVAEGADVRAFAWYDPNGSARLARHVPPDVRDAIELWPGDVRDRTRRRRTRCAAATSCCTSRRSSRSRTRTGRRRRSSPPT